MGKLKTKVKEIQSEFNDWLYDHHKTKASIDYVLAILLSTVSALIFAVGFNTFMDLLIWRHVRSLPSHHPYL